MHVSIHQPDFIPWLGFFDKIRLSDLFIIGDNVQFRKKGWTNRNQIKTANGASWLTIPVYQELGQSINVVKIRKESQNNRRSHQKGDKGRKRYGAHVTWDTQTRIRQI